MFLLVLACLNQLECSVVLCLRYWPIINLVILLLLSEFTLLCSENRCLARDF